MKAQLNKCLCLAFALAVFLPVYLSAEEPGEVPEEDRMSDEKFMLKYGGILSGLYVMPEKSKAFSLDAHELEIYEADPADYHMRLGECWVIVENRPNSQRAYWIRPMRCRDSKNGELTPRTKVGPGAYAGTQDPYFPDVYHFGTVRVVDDHHPDAEFHKLEMHVKEWDSKGVPKKVKFIFEDHDPAGGGSHPGHSGGRG